MSKAEKYMIFNDMRRNMATDESLLTDCVCGMGKSPQGVVCVSCLESRARMIMSAEELKELAKVGFDD